MIHQNDAHRCENDKDMALNAIVYVHNRIRLTIQRKHTNPYQNSKDTALNDHKNTLDIEPKGEALR